MTTKFDFKDLDDEGLETLQAIAEADAFNGWMYKTILPYCKGNILEIGSGIGNISTFFLEDGFKICLTDIRDNYCAKLKDRFSGYPNLIDIKNIDIVHPEFDTKYADLFESFDTIFALNVVEHIENDSLAMVNIKKLLTRGGKAIILVPAYQALYNRFDEELYHYRRYNKTMLVSIFKKAGFKIVKSFYFNFTGILGWYISGKLQKNKTIPKGQMKLYNSFVPVFKIIDTIVMRKMGLSVVTIGEKE